MIQLYNPNTPPSVLEGLTRNGDVILHPMSCVQHLVLNGTWGLEMVTPIDGTQADIVVDSVIRAPGQNGSDQLFRVYEVSPEMTQVVAKAYPIFMQAARDVFILDVRPTGKTCKQAVDLLLSGAVDSGSGYTYTCSSNITDTATAYIINKNLIEAIQGEGENTILKRWGGEVYYDNFNISIRAQQGADRGVRASFGYNMTGCRQTVNTDGVITRIVPISYGGYMMQTVYVDSPLIRNYPFVRTQVVHYEDIKLQADCLEGEEGYATLSQLRKALKARAQDEFTAGVDLPAITYDVSLANIEQATEYAGLTGLQTIHLGDTIHCYNERLGITTDARAVEIYFNCLTEKVDRVILGDYRPDYFSTLSNAARVVSAITDGNENVVAGRVAGILDAMQTQLRLQNTAAERADVLAVLFEDLDPASDLYGAMAIGTQGFQIANTRLPDDSDWDWKTFGTAAGFSAEYIIAGVLASQNYDGTQGVAIDLNAGTIYAPSLTVSAAQVDGLSDLQETVDTTSAYFRFGTWGTNDIEGAAVVLGNNMVLVSADAVSLIQNSDIDNPVAQLTQQRLVVTEGVFNTSLIVGKFKVIPRSNGNASVVYIGT